MVNCYCIRRPAVFFSSLFCSSFGGGFVASREMEMGSYLCTWAVSFCRWPNLLDQGGTFLTGTQSFLSSFPFRNQCHHVLKIRVNFPRISGRLVTRRIRSFYLSIGRSLPLPHSQPILLMCIDLQFASPDLQIGESGKCQKNPLKVKKSTKKNSQIPPPKKICYFL